MASLAPIPPAQEIKQVAVIEKPLPETAPPVNKPIFTAKIKRAENQSGPSRYFDTLIKSMASSLALKYHSSAPIIEGFLYEVCEHQYEIGIPAPVIMAIALKESAFKSSLFRQTGNPFGMKANPSWTGATISIHRNGKTIRFRKYETAEQAVVDFGKQIRSKWWYADALNCSFEDFNAVVGGLKKTPTEPGYAMNDDWDENILQLIEENDLGQLCRR